MVPLKGHVLFGGNNPRANKAARKNKRRIAQQHLSAQAKSWPIASQNETEPFQMRLFQGESSWRKHPEEEQAFSSRCRPLNRMFWRGISRRTYPTTISPIERLNCTASEAANTDTISMTGCRQNAKTSNERSTSRRESRNLHLTASRRCPRGSRANRVAGSSLPHPSPRGGGRALERSPGSEKGLALCAVVAAPSPSS